MSSNPNLKVIQPSGILTATGCPELAQEIKAALEAKVKIVLVDLQNVDFIDSSGLGTLVSVHTKLRLAGGKLYLCSPKDQARSLFDISDMDRILEIFPDRATFEREVLKKNMAVLVQ